MFNAPCESDLSLLACHVRCGVDVNDARPEFLATPLVTCILARREAVALFLLSHGADPHLLSESDGATAAPNTTLQAALRWWARAVDGGSSCDPRVAGMHFAHLTTSRSPS
jgi:uncharacterized protein